MLPLSCQSGALGSVDIVSILDLNALTTANSKRMPSARTYLTGAVLLIGCLGLTAYYWWAIRATGKPVDWNATELHGYYNYLGRAFAAGQLHLPIAPSPELLALPNPWDPDANFNLRMHDMVLYDGRYFLYHGAGPAVLLFTPWRLISGHDLPEHVAVFIFCVGGFLLYLRATARALSVSRFEPSSASWLVLVLALGVCQSAPFLCNRVDVYEVAIAGGYFCVAAAFLFLTFALTSRAPAGFLAASGLLFGIAVSCRPHLGACGAITLLVLIAWKWKHNDVPCFGIAAFATMFAIAGATVAYYNYSRFGDPTEFGLRYLLAGGTNQQRIQVTWPNTWTGLYYMLLSPPEFTAEFPWLRPALRLPPWGTFPRDYFIEAIAGVVFTTPFILAAALRHKGLGPLRWTVLLSATAVLIFIAATGFTTQRYLVDILPLLVFAAVLAFAEFLGRARAWKRVAATATFSALVIYSVAANLALGITGPYDGILTERPRSYVRIARWFTLAGAQRPILNPVLRVVFEMKPVPKPEGFREPLLAMGAHGSRHTLFFEHRGDQAMLISHSGLGWAPEATAIIANQPTTIVFAYDPCTQRVSVEADGRAVLSHYLPTLVTAPSQVVPGSNGYTGLRGQQWSGDIRLLEKTVTPH
jgi:hypothetical protein